jgi:hypothetical protein
MKVIKILLSRKRGIDSVSRRRSEEARRISVLDPTLFDQIIYIS